MSLIRKLHEFLLGKIVPVTSVKDPFFLFLRFGFVDFDSEEDCKAAKEAMEDGEIDGNKVTLDYAKPKGEGGFRGGRGGGGFGGRGGGRGRGGFGGRGGGGRGGRGGFGGRGGGRGGFGGKSRSEMTDPDVYVNQAGHVVFKV